MEYSNSSPEARSDAIRAMFALFRERETASLFQDKSLLDSSLLPTPMVGRQVQAEQLVRYLADASSGYLPALIQVYGPPGTGKTTVVERVVVEAEKQFSGLRTVFVNLKECRSLFSAANQILFQMTDAKEPPVSGLDGIFARIWDAAKGDAFLVLVLDEIDSIFEDKRYKPSDFLYRLLRHRETAEPPLVCVISLTNLLMGIDALLDSRVRSRMGTQSLYFPPYREGELLAILRSRASAFWDGALPEAVLAACARSAAEEHGDARRALDLLRTAGELADADGASSVDPSHVDRATEVLNVEETSRLIRDLPLQEILLIETLSMLADEAYAEMRRQGEGNPPENPSVPTEVVYQRYRERAAYWNVEPRGRRRLADFLQDLEMHGLVHSRMESSGRYGRRKMLWLEGDAIAIRYQAFAYLVEHHRPDLGRHLLLAPSG